MLRALLLFLLASCQQKEEPQHFYGNAMTIDYHIIVGTAAKKEQVEEVIKECFAEVDRIYNKWNPNSELSLLNRLPAHTKTTISKELLHLLALTQEVVALSEGRFDPTIEPVQKVWKEHLAQGKIPSDEDLADAISATGWEKIHFENSLFWKDHTLCSLDLGGIAKGLCVDLILERLRAVLKLNNLFVEWGGEIRAIGQHPDKRPWTIFISRLGDPNFKHAIDTVPLENQAIATSGDYLQNWTVGKTTYCHIIDPFEYKPRMLHKDSISSASVLASSCALADGLATAAMLHPSIEEAKEWALKIQESNPEIRFWLITSYVSETL